jgi:hypothetical protein
MLYRRFSGCRERGEWRRSAVADLAEPSPTPGEACGERVEDAR